MTSTATSENPAGPSPWSPRLLVGPVLAWIVVWFSLLKLPEPPSSGLDPSWRMVMGHAMNHGIQWGPDLVFTYGPLGYLLAATNHGANYAHFLIWQALSNAVFATVIVLLAREFAGWRRGAFYVFCVLLLAGYLDALHIAMVLLLSLAWLRDGVRRRPWLMAGIGVFLGVSFLIKFTHLMLGAFCLACVAGLMAHRRDWRGLALAVGSVAATFLGGWMLCGQSLANLPAYLATSLQSSAGYGDGMSLYEEPSVLVTGLVAGVAACLYYLTTLWRRTDLPRAFTVMLMLAAFSFINWKHGFTRADGHVFAHYLACMMVPLMFPIISLDDGPLRRLKVGLLGVSFAAAVWGTWSMLPLALTDSIATWNMNLKRTVPAVLDARELPARAQKAWDDACSLHKMGNVQGRVGDATIDLLGNEQAYLLFNRLNYHPRPVFQTYLPYTEELARLNRDFFRSDRAARFVLHKPDTIDYRLPASEDSLSTLEVFTRYRLVLEERGMLLWERRDQPPPDGERRLVLEKTVGFGENVPVPDLGDTPVWAEVDVRPTLLGSLRAFLYKAPILRLAITEAGGFRNSYRLVRRMGRTGFLAYPHLINAHTIKQYFTGEAAQRLEALAVELPEKDRWFFRPEVVIRYYALPAFPRDAEVKAGVSQDVFRMFDRPPSEASALYPVTILAEGGREVLFCHPPSELEFQVNFPATRATGQFGFAENAYRPPNATDGAEFIIEWVSPEGRTTRLLSRVLQPVTVPADRGPQAFQVDVPQGGGRLLLKITPGSAGNLAYDWTYWTDIRFRE